MTFPQLQYLLEIHRTGSITQAAKNLFVTQSSVSIALSSLEKELGFPVFIRSKKGLSLTPRGALIIEHAVRICESHKLMTSPIEQEHTYLRISGNANPLAQNAFIQLVKENKNRRDITFIFSPGDNTWEKLRNFRLEIAFSMTIGSHYLSKLSNINNFGLQSEILGNFPGCIRIGKGHRLFDATDITLEDLSNDLLLDTPTGSVSTALLSAGILQIKPEHRICSMHHGVRKALLSEGLAYEIAYYIPSIRDDNYRTIPLEGVHFKMHAVTNPLRPVIPEEIRFMELLRQELQQAGI